MDKFRKFWRYGFVSGSGGGSPEASKNQPKNQWENFENFDEFLPNFHLKKLILIKIKASNLEL